MADIRGRGLQSGADLFVLVCEYKKIDDQISVHTSRASADESLEAFKDSFDDYEWEEDYDTLERAKRFPGNDWVRVVRASNSEDGPCMRIELTKLQGGT